MIGGILVYTNMPPESLEAESGIGAGRHLEKWGADPKEFRKTA